VRASQRLLKHASIKTLHFHWHPHISDLHVKTAIFYHDMHDGVSAAAGFFPIPDLTPLKPAKHFKNVIFFEAFKSSPDFNLGVGSGYTP
jgi:hypothetical protein